MIGLVVNDTPGTQVMRSLPYIVAAFSGLAIISGGIAGAVRARRVDMNILMLIAVLGAIALGEFAEAAVVIFLNGVGEYLQALSLARTRGSIRDLMSLTPPEARVITPGGEKDVPLPDVGIGSLITVRVGERIPLDGVVIGSTAIVDEAPITGESLPVERIAGEAVYAGSLVTGSPIRVETTATEDDSMLARIVHLVQEAQDRKAPHEAFIDRFAAVYTPIVVGIAVAIIVVPALISALSPVTAAPLGSWVYRALTLLVIACPCALVISTPVTFVSAITRAAREGILIKGGAFLELGAQVDTVALDKTGTLTGGEPVVTRIEGSEGYSADRILALAAALEASSTHPLARAIEVHAEDSGLKIPSATDVVETPGFGVEGFVEGEPYRLGRVHGEPLSEAVELLSARGETVVALSSGSRVLGLLALADAIRQEAGDAVEELSTGAHGMHVVMLTGDGEPVAQRIAADAGVGTYEASLLPADKTRVIESLRADGATVAMVGDGINDAPALAAADVGIAMGSAGSDTALEVADVALMRDDLRALPRFFGLSRSAMLVVRQNIALALGAKLVVMALAIVGLADMWMAVFADTGIAVIVILNGMRLMLGAPAVARTGATPDGTEMMESLHVGRS